METTIIHFECVEDFTLMSYKYEAAGTVNRGEEVMVCHHYNSIDLIVRGFCFIVDPVLFNRKMLPCLEEVIK